MCTTRNPASIVSGNETSRLKTQWNSAHKATRAGEGNYSQAILNRNKALTIALLENEVNRDSSNSGDTISTSRCWRLK